mmetsp:Transcript_21085/g.32587  ORF Transcript_21085/g.32587 Transcript_21085/m.32587 type:complete len:160 (+) Transcript_21085:250-729(+)
MEEGDDSQHAECQTVLWDGSIPVEFIISAEDVTVLQTPVPYFVLIPRMSYLPCHTEEVLKYFENLAPGAQNQIWFEHAGTPLNWNLPFGVLYDLVQSNDILPWTITIHFQNFPLYHQIPRWEGCQGAERSFLHSLKQGCYLQHGSARPFMGLGRTTQET